MIAIDAKPGGDLTIGAMTPLSALEYSNVVHDHAPVITRTLKTLSNIRVRNVATVGGNLAHGDPHMDLPPYSWRLARALPSRAGRANAKFRSMICSSAILRLRCGVTN